MADADGEVRELERRDGAEKGGEKSAEKRGGEKSFVKAHRDQILIVLTLVGVVIAYLAFKKPSGSGGPTAAPTGYDPTAAAGVPNVGGPGDAGGALDGFSAYLSHMQQTIDQLQSTVDSSAATSTPTSHVPKFDYSSMNHSWANEPVTAPARFLYGRAAKGLHYIRRRSTGQVGQVNPNGKIFWLSGSQYAELGHPKTTLFGAAPRHRAKPKPKKPKPQTRR